jgi:DNA-directed RNA polymerase sigma subunit (sigma70/sigma32)
MECTDSREFDRLVDHIIAEALGLLSDQQDREIIIRKFGLRDGRYQADLEIADALSLTSRQVYHLGRRALRVILGPDRTAVD